MSTTTTSLRDVEPVGDWRQLAACRGVDPELFFPASEEGPLFEAQVAAAKAVCAGCPVRAECLDEALTRIPYGIAGGLTPDERRRLPQQASAEPTAVLEAGLQQGARRAEVEAAGRVLLEAGRSIREVANRCGVSERTATRWAARARAISCTSTADGGERAEGSRGGNRAPLLFSHTHNPWQGPEQRKDTDSR